MSTKSIEVVFATYSLGDLQLKNRIVMAPPTRTRAGNKGKVPNELMTEYYAQSLHDVKQALGDLDLLIARPPANCGPGSSPTCWPSSFFSVFNNVRAPIGRTFSRGAGLGG
jgi:hypothetical protein